MECDRIMSGLYASGWLLNMVAKLFDKREVQEALVFIIILMGLQNV